MSVYVVLVASHALSLSVHSSSVSLSTADANTTPTNINFIEVIKKDLKHNNDDYKEMKRSSITTLINKKNAKEEVERFRRVNRRYSEEYEYGIPIINTETVLLKHNATKDKNESKVAKLNGVVLPTVDIPKFINKHKVDKFQQFMEKNKELLKQYISSKMGQTHTEATVVRASKPQLKSLVRPALLRGALQRKKVQRHGEDEEVLAPELLDMAPAKGGRVHKQRLKGRLCHRHVLMPEGPKYDSSGKWYLKEHPPSALRPYEVTHHPKLLLPRCCNCCKKSVLGCE